MKRATVTLKTCGQAVQLSSLISLEQNDKYLTILRRTAEKFGSLTGKCLGEAGIQKTWAWECLPFPKAEIPEALSDQFNAADPFKESN